MRVLKFGELIVSDPVFSVIIVCLIISLLPSQQALAEKFGDAGDNKTNCELSESALERLYLSASETLKSFVSESDVADFINRVTCNQFIRASLKIEYLTEHVGSRLFSIRDIESDVGAIIEEDRKVLMFVELGELALSRGDEEMAARFVLDSSNLVGSVDVTTKTGVSAIIKLANLYARLGKTREAYILADKIDGESKEALLFQLNRYRKLDKMR